MKSNAVLNDLELFMLPDVGRTLTCGHEFVLSDNFQDVDTSREIAAFVASDYPFKLGFTMSLFCTQGSLQVRLNLKEYTLCRGDVLVTMPGNIGECLSVSEDCRMGIIAFSGRRYLPELSTGLSVSFRTFLVNHSCLHLSEKELQELLVIYGLMREKVQQEGFAYVRESLRGYMQVLCYLSFQCVQEYNRSRGDEKAKDRSGQLFDRFMQLVQKHYTAEREVKFYADKMCLTPKYLSQAVCQASGRYAGEWIRDYVILEAKALLKSKRYTVQQVADMLHFSNQSFFGKYFKAVVGCSPRHYMQE